MIDEMSFEDYVKSQRKPKRPKYRNKRVRIDGHTFDSKMEGARYLDLKRLANAKRIIDLRIHPKFELRGEQGEKVATYSADFSYFEVGQEGVKYDEYIVEDVKGKRTEAFNIKKKWMLVDYGVDVKLITSDMVDTRGMEQYVIGGNNEATGGADTAAEEHPAVD